MFAYISYLNRQKITRDSHEVRDEFFDKQKSTGMKIPVLFAIYQFLISGISSTNSGRTILPSSMICTPSSQTELFRQMPSLWLTAS